MATGTSLLSVSPYGPLLDLALHVHDLANSGRPSDALAAAETYEPVAQALGDDKTVDFLMQGRVYAYQYLGQFPQAMRVGNQLLGRHRARGNATGEAKVLADLADLSMLSGHPAEGIEHLARAGLVLETIDRRNDRYASALAAYGQAANTAGLFEVAGSAYEQVIQHHDTYSASRGSFVEQRYLELLIAWAFRLDHVGQHLEASARLRRAATISARWLANCADPDPRDPSTVTDRWEMLAVQALALAKLGESESAIALVGPVLIPLRENNLAGGAWAAHLALGVALGTRAATSTAARRELLAARDWCGQGNWTDDEFIVTHELALLAARTCSEQTSRDMLAGLQLQARLLWQQRLQGLAMLHQARDRAKLEIERARAQEALLRDPLTGLGYRRCFDQVLATVDGGDVQLPLTLLVVDVDKFKSINDTYSHAVGDSVLREMATILADQCRKGRDNPIRYAGDEFTIFCHTDIASATQIAERIRAAVAEHHFEYISDGISVSIGGAELTTGMTGAELFNAADAHLYEAKRHGRDCVAV